MLAILLSIPSRSKSCATCKKGFEGGQKLVSVLRKGEEGFVREDLCESCWKEDTAVWSSWHSRYPTPAKGKEMALPVKERAMQLLREYLDQQQSESAYMLAMYLRRRRVLRKVREHRERPEETDLYEVAASGECLQVPRIDVVQERDRVYTEILKQLAGEDASH